MWVFCLQIHCKILSIKKGQKIKEFTGNKKFRKEEKVTEKKLTFQKVKEEKKRIEKKNWKNQCLKNEKVTEKQKSAFKAFTN